MPAKDRALARSTQWSISTARTPQLTLLVLDFALDIVDGVGRFHLKGYGLAGQGLHKDLHVACRTRLGLQSSAKQYASEITRKVEKRLPHTRCAALSSTQAPKGSHLQAAITSENPICWGLFPSQAPKVNCSALGPFLFMPEPVVLNNSSQKYGQTRPQSGCARGNCRHFVEHDVCWTCVGG